MDKIGNLCETPVRTARAACFFHRILIRSFDQT